MNRQGDFSLGHSMVIIIITFFVVALAVGTLLLITALSQLPDDKIRPLTHQLMASQLVNTPQCFAYQDVRSGRVDQGIIDPVKLTNATFHNCLRLSEERIKSAKIIIITEELTPHVTTLSTTYWGGAGTTTEKITKQVYIKRQDRMMPAIITIYLN